MKVFEGQLVEVNHSRKGRFVGKAIRDFDTDNEWFPLALHEPEVVRNKWERGEEIPCRKSLLSSFAVRDRKK